MKKVTVLALLFSVLTACSGSPLGTQTGLPSLAPTDTLAPAPMIIPTVTPFIGQVFIEHAQIIYYDVSGSTAAEIRASMDKSRPKDPYDGNRPVDAYTDWYISWSWPGYGTDHCDLSTASVTYTINVSVPRWKVPADASSALIAKWETYIQSLISHEKGHVNNVVSNYSSVKAAIQNATCSTADSKAQKALVPLREFDANYDRQTKHGEAQGAVFP